MIYRGNIVEVKEDSLVVMLDDCTFQYVKKHNGLEEGMEMYFEDRDIIKRTSLNLRSIALIAASIFLFIATTFYGVDIWNTNYKAVAIVSVDINPSVEIKVNKNHNVIKAIALNEDAKELPLEDLKSQPIDKALQELVNMARVEGYIKETDENYILVTSVDLTENKEEEKILNELIAGGKEKIEDSAVEEGEQVQVIAIRSNQETLEEAKKENVSVGKKEITKNKGVKEIKELKDIKDIKSKLEKEKEKIEKHIKDIEKEANNLKDKLEESQENHKSNNGNNGINNSNKNNNIEFDKYNEIINKGQDRVKEMLKFQQNIEKVDPKEQMQKQKKELKEKLKNEKDVLKQKNNNSNNGQKNNKNGKP